MSRRRQRGAAYRARRAERTHRWRMLNDVYYRTAIEIQRAAADEAIRNTAAYADWVTPHTATGAHLDKLMELTPVSSEEVRTRMDYAYAATHLVGTAACESCGQTFIHATNCPLMPG